MYFKHFWQFKDPRTFFGVPPLVSPSEEEEGGKYQTLIPIQIPNPLISGTSRHDTPPPTFIQNMQEAGIGIKKTTLGSGLIPCVNPMR